MKIKDAKKPCKMGAGTRGLGRGALGAPGGAACFRLGVVLGLPPGREERDRCSPGLAGGGLPYPRACRASFCRPPAGPLLLSVCSCRSGRYTGGFFTRAPPNGIPAAGPLSKSGRKEVVMAVS